MRPLGNLIIFVLTISAALALEDNHPETWRSRNKKYAIKEAFYGEGKRVVAIFVNLATGRSTVIDGAGARNSAALWSPDSHYVAQLTSSAVTIGRMRLSIGWSMEEFQRLSFLLRWKLLGFFQLPRRTRFSTLGLKQSVPSDGSVLTELSSSPRQQAAGFIGSMGINPQTSALWMWSSTSSLRFPEAQQRSLSPMQTKEPNRAIQLTGCSASRPLPQTRRPSGTCRAALRR
jgi:hypothetical protein